MKKIILAAALISIFNLQFTLCLAQSANDPVLMEVAGKQIRQSEFMAEFLPTVDKDVVGKQEKHQALVDYVNLFANFRAKVADAKAMGMDTAASLERELKGYRNELAAPYLIDSNTLVSLINEAYGRNRYQLHAAHILVRVTPDASAADTMKALQHITELRNRIVNGEDFFAVSVEEMTEQVKDQPNRRVRPNEGDLGYFTAFDMVYPFENAAYGLNVGEVSQPVRTVYGYHIVYLIDKVEWYGKAKIAHIWYRDGEHPAINGTIDTVYKRLTEGVSFTQLARQSDDRQSADNGGELNEVPLGQLLPEYVNAFKDLKAGEFSKPFHTQYGWHIVKLLKRDTLPPLEKMMPYYKQRMSRDQRGGASRKVFATHCRERFDAVDYTVTPQPQPKGRKRSKAPAPMMASLDQLIAQVNDSVYICKWNARRAIDSLTDMRPLCKVNGKVYNAIDLAQYIGSHQVPGPIEEHGYYVRKRYEAFIDSIAVSLADQRLEQDYPEFASVIDDYRRGLMIFNYNDKMVWSKAMQDTLGYEAFYARESKKKSLANPEDSIYFWNTRARVVAIDIQDSVCLAPEKAVKLMRKALKKNLTSAEMRDMLTKKLNKNYDSKKAIRLWVDLVEKGNQKLLKDGMWSREVYSYPVKKGYRVLVVQEILEPTLKSSTEARGYYLNAYQNDVEQQLNERLRKQYNVKINWNVIDKITY